MSAKKRGRKPISDDQIKQLSKREQKQVMKLRALNEKKRKLQSADTVADDENHSKVRFHLLDESRDTVAAKRRAVEVGPPKPMAAFADDKTVSDLLQELHASKQEIAKRIQSEQRSKKIIKGKQQRIRRVSAKFEILKEQYSNLEGLLQNHREVIQAQSNLITEMSEKLDSYYQAYMANKYSQEISISMGQPMPSFETTKFQNSQELEDFKDEHICVKFYLAMFKVIMAGTSSREDVYAFMRCLRGALPSELNPNHFRNFLSRYIYCCLF